MRTLDLWDSYFASSSHIPFPYSFLWQQPAFCFSISCAFLFLLFRFDHLPYSFRDLICLKRGARSVGVLLASSLGFYIRSTEFCFPPFPSLASTMSNATNGFMDDGFRVDSNIVGFIWLLLYPLVRCPSTLTIFSGLFFILFFLFCSSLYCYVYDTSKVCYYGNCSCRIDNKLPTKEGMWL